MIVIDEREQSEWIKGTLIHPAYLTETPILYERRASVKQKDKQ